VGHFGLVLSFKDHGTGLTDRPMDRSKSANFLGKYSVFKA